MAKAIMVMGTASDVGKSVVAAGLCRIFHRAGIDVAPFKAQNMSLNSFVTADGGEMGRAQVLQAQACGLSPHVDMNPILLKPEADNRSQVVVHGKLWGKYDGHSYFARRDDLFYFVRESYERLARVHDLIVIEGAGSAAEVNLRDRDIVNWPVAELADSQVLLLADIDRGGVFAQVIGTLDLLSHNERRRVMGIVVNKFRGDSSLFADGVRFLEERAHLPVLGVVPFLREVALDQEDSVEIARHPEPPFKDDRVNLAVLLLPHMSNFTDFNALAAETDVVLRYVKTPVQLAGADAAIIPGSKSTIADLNYLDQAGFGAALSEHVAGGGEVVGICGGYQMLGREISDPHGIESGGTRKGFGLLNVATELTEEKTTVQVEARSLECAAAKNETIHGYEIHMGRTVRGATAPRFCILRRFGGDAGPDLDQSEINDGAANEDGRVWGTYIHGVFDRAEFRRRWLNELRRRKGLDPLAAGVSENVDRKLTGAIDRWADHLARHVDLKSIFSVLGLPRETDLMESKVVTQSQNW